MLPIEQLSQFPILRTNEQLFVDTLMKIREQLEQGFSFINRLVEPESKTSTIYLKNTVNRFAAWQTFPNNNSSFYLASIGVEEFPQKTGARRMSLTHLKLPYGEKYDPRFYTTDKDFSSPEWNQADVRRFLTDVNGAEVDTDTTQKEFKRLQDNPNIGQIFWNSNPPPSVN